MAKPELGTKRVCPETGRKFYDLQKDPIVSPYTGKSYPVSFFEDAKPEPVKAKAAAKKAPVDDEVEKDDIEEVETDDAVVSLEDADEADTDDDVNLPDLGDNTDDEILGDDDDDDDDTFLADEDDDDDDVAGIVDVATDDDDS